MQGTPNQPGSQIMFETFVPKNFSGGSLAIIEHANAIIEEYQAAGFVLTLRQLYYQFVSRDLLKNQQSEYKRLGSIINDARLAGLIDWDAIEDRTRTVRTLATWDDPAQIIDAVARQYREDLWANQEFRPEVWIEKDALLGVIEPVCDRWRIPYFACRGYSSQSAQYAAGKRFARVAVKDQIPIVLHLGDHDPSGMDMTRDNADRLEMFAGDPVELRRLALNMDQVKRYRPPPNPAKESDGRSAAYIAQYGPKSWELDALDPKVIDALIEKEIKTILDASQWAKDKLAESDRKAGLAKAASNWTAVEKFLEKKS
jgi:hypothetical protein